MFRKTLTMLFVALGVFTMSAAVTGCEAEEEPLENEVEELEDGVEDAGNEIDDAM